VCRFPLEIDRSLPSNRVCIRRLDLGVHGICAPAKPASGWGRKRSWSSALEILHASWQGANWSGASRGLWRTHALWRPHSPSSATRAKGTDERFSSTREAALVWRGRQPRAVNSMSSSLLLVRPPTSVHRFSVIRRSGRMFDHGSQPDVDISFGLGSPIRTKQRPIEGELCVVAPTGSSTERWLQESAWRLPFRRHRRRLTRRLKAWQGGMEPLRPLTRETAWHSVGPVAGIPGTE
jgi:hypothetical protein